MTSETVGNKTVEYAYDVAGRRTMTKWPDGYCVSYQYDHFYTKNCPQNQLKSHATQTQTNLQNKNKYLNILDF